MSRIGKTISLKEHIFRVIHQHGYDSPQGKELVELFGLQYVQKLYQEQKQWIDSMEKKHDWKKDN